MGKEGKPQVEQRQDPLNNVGSSETLSLVQQYLALRQEVKALLSPYKPEIVVHLTSDGPWKNVHVGDTHFAHDASDNSALQEAVGETGKDGILITHANIIEAVSNKFLSTNTTKVGLNLDEQEAVVSAILHPVDKDHRLVPLGANTCHEGWSEKTATHDPLHGIISPRTQALYNGGQIVFKRGDTVVSRYELYHNSGSGDTSQSPEGALRARYREGNPEGADLLAGAHMHQLTAGQDVYHDPIKGKDVVRSLGVVGAAKGSEENPDKFLIGLGVSPKKQPGDAARGFVSIIKDPPGREPSVYPVAGYTRAGILFEAEKLWEDAQRTGTIKEIKEQIAEKHTPPPKEFHPEKSETRAKDPAAMSEGDAPYYKSLDWDIRDADLPIRIQFLGNLRIGSQSFKRDRTLEILNDIDKDPWAYYFATRRLVNQGTAQRADRQHILRNLTHVLGTAKSSLLGVMLTDELRVNAWSKKRKRENGGGYAESLSPGDWIYNASEIKGTPIMMPESVVRLRVGKIDYTLYERDRLAHLTSLINPFHGLTRVSQIWGIDADVLVGGNTEGIGWRTWMRPWGKQLEVVVPGGFAEYIEKGIGNRVDYPEGGQGSVYSPNERMVFSGATASDVHDLHEALWMREGLRQEQTLTKTMKKLEKIKRTMKAGK